jgi:hypothetical protein
MCACSAAVGAWSGQLWGLVQDLTTGDNAIDGLALTYADEQKLTDSNGNVTTLILQMQVRGWLGVDAVPATASSCRS